VFGEASCFRQLCLKESHQEHDGIAVTTAASKLVRLEFKRKAAGLTPGGIDLHQRSFDKVTGDFTP